MASGSSLLSGKAAIRVTATIICHYKMEVWFGEEEGPLLKKGPFPLPNLPHLSTPPPHLSHYSFKNSRQRAEC